MARRILRHAEHDAIFREAVDAQPPQPPTQHPADRPDWYKDNQYGNDVMRAIDNRGGKGLTMKRYPHPTEEPPSGTMVSLPGREQQIPHGKLNPSSVTNYVNQHAQELSEPDNFYGGWHEDDHPDGPQWFHDVSRNFDDPWEAAGKALEWKQRGVYDVDNDTDVKTPQFWHDQIAKGGARHEQHGQPRRAGSPEGSLRPPEDQASSGHFARRRDQIRPDWWKHTANRREIFSGQEEPHHDVGIPLHPQAAYWGPEDEEAPDHDWTQHGLGDPEDWELEDANHLYLAQRIAAAMGEYDMGAPDPAQLTPTGQQTNSTHGAEVHQDPGGNKWLMKKSPKSAPFLAAGDVAASAIQQHSGLKTPATFLTKMGKQPASAQHMFPNAKDAYPNKEFNPEKVPDNDLMTIQKHHALDWLIGNHDAHGGQFIRDQDGDLVGIDKGQAFKHIAQDRLHWNHHPNQAYGEAEPVYNTLYRNFAKGGRQLFDPREGELAEYIQGLQNIPDDEFQQTLSPYAEGAAQAGMLAGQFDSNNYPGLEPNARIPANDPQAFLQHVDGSQEQPDE